MYLNTVKIHTKTNPEKVKTWNVHSPHHVFNVPSQGNNQRVQELLQSAAVVFWVALHVGRVDGLFPLPALHGHAPPPPVGDALLHRGLVAQGVVFAEEEERRGGDGVVVEHQDAAVVEVGRLRFEEPEVKQSQVFDTAFEAWHQSFAQT